MDFLIVLRPDARLVVGLANFELATKGAAPESSHQSFCAGVPLPKEG